MQNLLVRILPKVYSKVCFNHVPYSYYLNLKYATFVRFCWGRIIFCAPHLSGWRDLIIAVRRLWTEESPSSLLVQNAATLTSWMTAALKHVVLFKKYLFLLSFVAFMCEPSTALVLVIWETIYLSSSSPWQLKSDGMSKMTFPTTSCLVQWQVVLQKDL